MASRSWNRVELMGNLTRDPELRYTPQGTAVCTFGLATNRSYVYEGERREEVCFHRIVAWNKLAELCNQLLKKGSRTFVAGRLQTREWEGQDGQKRQTTEVVIEDMILLTSGARVGVEEPVAEEAEEAPLADEKLAKPAEDKADSSQVENKQDDGKKKADETISEGDLADLPF